MLKHFIDNLISSILEIKVKIFTEIGVASGVIGIPLISGHQIFAYIHRLIPYEWISWLAEGVMNGIGGGAGALIFAYLFRKIGSMYLKIKSKKK